MTFSHILANVINGTPPPKHMRARDSRGRAMTNAQLAAMPKLLDLERIAEKCEEYGADPADVIAYSLTPEARAQAETTGMTLYRQADLSYRLVDKANASKKALDVDAKVTGTVVMLQSGDADL